eukprot:scaffold18151_cov63-Attheya_sp.AAC.2
MSQAAHVPLTVTKTTEPDYDFIPILMLADEPSPSKGLAVTKTPVSKKQPDKYYKVMLDSELSNCSPTHLYKTFTNPKVIAGLGKKKLPNIEFIAFRTPLFKVPATASKLPFASFLQLNQSSNVFELFQTNILDHLHDLEFVTMNKENETASEFMKQNLWHCADEEELIKFGHCSITMGDMDRLLNNCEYVNDKIINCSNFVASALSLVMTQCYPKVTDNNLPATLILSTYALQDVCIVPSEPIILDDVESLNQEPVSKFDMDDKFAHDDPFTEMCTAWYATHAFGEIARTLGRYSRCDYAPSKLLCIFNRDVGVHWTVYEIDI